MELKVTLKKITSMLLLASVICGFTACGDKTGGEKDTAAADTTARLQKTRPIPKSLKIVLTEKLILLFLQVRQVWAQQSS